MSVGTTGIEKSSHVVKATPILRECSERKVGCRLHLLHSGQLVDATFHDARAGQVVLRVAANSRYDALQPEALCCVAFPFHQSLHAFVACVTKSRDGQPAQEIHFDEPATLMVTNLRRAYRVPVNRDAGVELTLTWNTPAVTFATGELLNLSESGFEMDLPVNDDRLPVDTEARCRFRFRDECVELPAIVRRCQQARRAFQFSLSRTPETRQTILTLQRLVRSLEQVWLKSRHAPQNPVQR